MTTATHTSDFSIPDPACREDIGALLRVSQSQITVLSRRGDLPPSFKVGKRRYWRRADVLSWLDQRSSTTSTAEAAA